MAARREDLNLGELAVLAVLAEGPTHGFAVARATAPGGEVGAIWSIRRPLVYRAMDLLAERGLIEAIGDEWSPHGPRGRVMRATELGRAEVRRWLREPVAHVRDARSALLLKLLFLDRAGRDPAQLLAAQAQRFGAALHALNEQRAHAAGFDHVLLAWRVESASAAMRFIETLAAKQT